MSSSPSSADNRFAKNYEIAEPITFETFSPPAAPVRAALQGASERSTRGRYAEAWEDAGKPMPLDAAGKKVAPPATEKTNIAGGIRETRAIWIVHGMGQQIPFETVDSLAQGVLSVAKPPGIKPRLRTVRVC